MSRNVSVNSPSCDVELLCHKRQASVNLFVNLFVITTNFYCSVSAFKRFVASEDSGKRAVSQISFESDNDIF